MKLNFPEVEGARREENSKRKRKAKESVSRIKYLLEKIFSFFFFFCPPLTLSFSLSLPFSFLSPLPPIQRRSVIRWISQQISSCLTFVPFCPSSSNPIEWTHRFPTTFRILMAFVLRCIIFHFGYCFIRVIFDVISRRGYINLYLTVEILIAFPCESFFFFFSNPNLEIY